MSMARWCGLLLLTLVFANGCGGAVSPPAFADSSQLFSLTRERYAKASGYTDSGIAVSVSDGGDVERVDFATEFRRNQYVTFDFQSALGAQTVLRANLRSNVVTINAGGQTEDEVSLVAAAHKLGGVSVLASRFVPLLLLGQDPCDCLEASPKEMSPQSVDNQRRLVPVVFESPKRSLTFWIEPQQKLIWRIDIAVRTDPAARIKIYFRNIRVE